MLVMYDDVSAAEAALVLFTRLVQLTGCLTSLLTNQTAGKNRQHTAALIQHRANMTDVSNTA